MGNFVQQGSRSFVTVHRPGDCDGAAIAALLTEAGRYIAALEPMWVRQVSLDVDHNPVSAEVSLTVSYDPAAEACGCEAGARRG